MKTIIKVKSWEEQQKNRTMLQKTNKDLCGREFETEEIKDARGNYFEIGGRCLIKGLHTEQGDLRKLLKPFRWAESRNGTMWLILKEGNGIFLVSMGGRLEYNAFNSELKCERSDIRWSNLDIIRIYQRAEGTPKIMSLNEDFHKHILIWEDKSDSNQVTLVKGKLFGDNLTYTWILEDDEDNKAIKQGDIVEVYLHKKQLAEVREVIQVSLTDEEVKDYRPARYKGGF